MPCQFMLLIQNYAQEKILLFRVGLHTYPSQFSEWSIQIIKSIFIEIILLMLSEFSRVGFFFWMLSNGGIEIHTTPCASQYCAKNVLHSKFRITCNYDTFLFYANCTL